MYPRKRVGSFTFDIYIISHNYTTDNKIIFLYETLVGSFDYYKDKCD